MQHKNIILNSLKESFAAILRDKRLFLLLFVLQIFFFVILFLLNNVYIPKIVISAQAITDYLSKQNLDEAAVTSNLLQQKSILGDDPLSISRNFNDILKNFRFYLVYSFLLLVIFGSISWPITKKIIHKSDIKQLIGNFFKNLVVLLFYLGLIFSFFFSLLNISFTELAMEGQNFLIKYIVFLIFSIILIYFMFISLSLLHNTNLSNIVQKTLIIGVKKVHYILSAYFINIFLFSISIFLLYYFLEKSLFVLFFSLVLIIFSFVFGRIFMVNVVEKLG